MQNRRGGMTAGPQVLTGVAVGMVQEGGGGEGQGFRHVLQQHHFLCPFTLSVRMGAGITSDVLLRSLKE